jgi:hypothetical protein
VTVRATALRYAVCTMLVADLGSGMNDYKKGLKRLLTGILSPAQMSASRSRAALFSTQ